MSKRLIQLTLSPEEAVWLYCAMAAGHHLALALGAETTGDNSIIARERSFSRHQAVMTAQAGCVIEFSEVAQRLERLINSCRPEGMQVTFLGRNGEPR